MVQDASRIDFLKTGEVLMQEDSNLADFKKALADVPSTSAALQVVFIETGANAQALQYFGIEAKDAPAFVIHDQNNNAKYVSFKTSPSKLPKFVSDYEVTHCKPWSSPIAL